MLFLINVVETVVAAHVCNLPRLHNRVGAAFHFDKLLSSIGTTTKVYLVASWSSSKTHLKFIHIILAHELPFIDSSRHFGSS